MIEGNTEQIACDIALMCIHICNNCRDFGRRCLYTPADKTGIEYKEHSMKRLIRRIKVLLCTAFVTVAVMTGTIIASAENMTLSAHDAVKDITVGWNLGNSLDCYESPEFGADGMASEELWGNPPVARELISEVKKAGFNAIRIPVTWYNHMDFSRQWCITRAFSVRMSISCR